jgi:ABC-2 type transport system ATP-binding protein
MPDALIAARQLTKRFGTRTAVDGVSFEIRPGESVGLLGPNGAGKTTTFSMITGLIRPDSGSVAIDGRAIVSDTDPLKRRFGLVPQDLALYDDLGARRNLEFFAAIQGVPGRDAPKAIEDALAFVGLSDRAGDRVGTFSGGMKRRLNIAAALLHDPDILLLDEPTVGVDPQSRNAIFDNITALRSRGKTILYTTHYMEEVERLCDRVIIIDAGRVIADDTLGGLRHRAGMATELRISLVTGPAAHVLDTLRGMATVASVEAAGTDLRVRLKSVSSGSGEVLTALEKLGVEVRSFAAEPPDLESVFLELTGRSLRDG